MTIRLPGDLESSIRGAVDDGRFASLDEAMAEAARLLIRELHRGQSEESAVRPEGSGLGSIGAMSDEADLLDRAVEHAMKVREERPWRLDPVE